VLITKSIPHLPDEVDHDLRQGAIGTSLESLRRSPACADVGFWIGALADRFYDLKHTGITTLAALAEDGRRRSSGTVRALLARETYRTEGAT